MPTRRKTIKSENAGIKEFVQPTKAELQAVSGIWERESDGRTERLCIRKARFQLTGKHPLSGPVKKTASTGALKLGTRVQSRTVSVIDKETIEVKTLHSTTTWKRTKFLYPIKYHYFVSIWPVLLSCQLTSFEIYSIFAVRYL